MSDFEYIPPTLAEKCVQYLPAVPSMEAWAEMCLEAVIREGAGPMLHASRMWIRVGHHPDVRKIMRQAAESRICWLQLVSRI
jgi:hypothetical protein